VSVLVISPDYASHYGPLAVIGRAVRACGGHVVVATGPTLRASVESDGFEWRPLRLGASSNDGVAAPDASIERFIAATSEGPISTIRRQALDRERDLLWEPERVATDIAQLCSEVDPDEVLVDHVSFGSTLGMYATGRSFVTLVPGHPSQLPLGAERYGVPAEWPSHLRQDARDLVDLERLVDRVTTAFTTRWNDAVARVAPDRDAVGDAFRVHGRRVLYNSVPALTSTARSVMLPADHRFVGPLTRDEALPDEYRSWAERNDDRTQVYVALGTFLSHRGDVLGRLADALRQLDARASIATGATPPALLGRVPTDWVVAPRLPQVALMSHADLVVHHGGNNSVQEALAAGARQLVMPFSTDQFANAADLERLGAATVTSPNDDRVAELVDVIDLASRSTRPRAHPRPTPDELVDALFDRRPGERSDHNAVAAEAGAAS
jgi:UDP:flavonoid glycosyltransferase YjiC (YdhE family)